MTDKATNSHLFGGGKKRPSQPPYKRVEVSTIATTYSKNATTHDAVVLVRDTGLKTYEARHYGSYPTRLEALQRAHYINANMIMRTGDPLPKQTSTGGNGKTVAVFKELGYSL